MKRTRLFPTLLVLGLLVGCGSNGSDEKAAPKDTAASPSTSPSSAPTLSQDELQAKVISNAAPKDLVWNAPKTPAGWRSLSTQQGAAQWQVGKEPCTVILDQPSGVGEAKEPTSEQVLDREIQRIAKSVQATGQPKTVSKEPVMVSNEIVGLDGSSKTRFAHTQVDYGNGAEADIRAHRAGDFALIAVVACGQGRFNELYAKEIAPFLDTLSARTTY